MSQSPPSAESQTAAWFALMRRGDYAAAWEISDRVLAQCVAAGRVWHLPRHQQWVWDGTPLENRTVLVHCYHGLGDTIQFARFLPLVAQVARATTVWAQPPLVPLLGHVPGAGRILPLHDGAPEVERDVDIEIMELAHALRVSLETLPCGVPYVDVPAAPRLSERRCVGVVAQTGDWDNRRDVPPELLSACLDQTGWDVFSLQLGRPVPGVVDASAPDIVSLAGRLRSLDLVVTADTMAAHLAGALGVRTWTLLHHDADWRWMSPERSDSPWYPSMCLFRQPRPGDWQSVLDDVRDRLLCER